MRFLTSWHTCFWVLIYAFLIDSAFKIFDSTPDWGWHPLDRSYWHFVAGLVLYSACMLFPYARLAGSIAMAGLLGNWIWTLNPRGVANPFVFGDTAYNVADVYLMATPFLLVTGLIVYMAVPSARPVEGPPERHPD